MKQFAPLALALTLAATAPAQSPPHFTDPANLRGERIHPRDGRELPIDGGPGMDGKPNNTLALQQLLRKLNTRASILNIVAHPDDEDGGMLTFYARGFGARVADLSLTRGEGGQNAMTADFEDALGLLRTQELLANDRYTGVDQMFGTEVDFGFSKTKEEAFGKWTHERCLYDAVRAIRLYRPLVITATFIGGVTDGHGQHQVSGQVAQEAFKAAGDPNVFPDMIAEGILPWQPLRIYARVPAQSITPQGLYDYATGQYTPARFTNYVTGETSTTPPSTDVIVHEGTPDSLLADERGTPRSYIQFARIGLGLQKSQIGPGFRTAPAGAFDVPYHLYGTAICGSPVSIKNCYPSRSGGAALAVASSFFEGIDTTVEGIGDTTLVPFPTLQAVLRVISGKIRAAVESFDTQKPQVAAPLLAEALLSVDQAFPVVQEFKLGAPNAKEAVIHELLIKRVQLNEALALALGLRLTAKTTSSELPAGRITTAAIESAQETDAASLHSTLGVTESASKHFPAVPEGEKPACKLDALQTGPTLPYFYRDSIEDPVYKLRTPAWRNSPSGPPAFACLALYSYHSAAIEVAVVARSGDQPVRFMPADATHLHVVGYGELPRTNYISAPAKTVSLAGLKLPASRRIAYLPGTGDSVPEALKSIGLPPVILSVGDLTPGKLAGYDTVVLGVRTYNALPDLHGAPTQALLDFARNGGNVVVQFQTAEFTQADAPYPLTLGYDAEKIVDETDPVRLLDPTHPLLTTPNRITPADFDGWVNERGHGILRSWDPRYAALTETHDPGSSTEAVKPQEPQRGALITTRLGKGRWTYCAFALYRQLPEANSGAFRIFANLLSLGRASAPSEHFQHLLATSYLSDQAVQYIGWLSVATIWND